VFPGGIHPPNPLPAFPFLFAKRPRFPLGIAGTFGTFLVLPLRQTIVIFPGLRRKHSGDGGDIRIDA